MSLNTFQKDPDAKLDYTVDWTAWLSLGDSIASSTWIVPSDITATGGTHTTKQATILLAGGVVGQMYICTNRITTATGLIDDRSILLVIIDK